MLSARVQLRLITGWFLSLLALLGIGAAAGLQLSMTEGVGLFVLATVPAGLLLRALRHTPKTAGQVLRVDARGREGLPLARRTAAGGGL